MEEAFRIIEEMNAPPPMINSRRLICLLQVIRDLIPQMVGSGNFKLTHSLVSVVA
jgi:hypothetical protein